MRNENYFSKCLIYIFIIVNFFLKFLISYLRIPYKTHYILDLLIVILFIFDLKYIIKNFKFKKNLFFLIFFPILMFFIISVLSAIINKTPIFLFLWHLRNYYRYYIPFCSIMFFFNKSDIKKIINIGFYFLVIHCVLCIAQYYTFPNNFFQDSINGIFGNTKGYNTYSLFFLIFYYTYFTIEFIKDSKKYRWRYFITIITCLLVTALSELKMFYVLSVLIVIGTNIFLLPLKKYKELFITIFSTTFLVIISIFLLNKFYSYITDNPINYGKLDQYLNNISYGYEYKKFTEIKSGDETISIPTINRFSGFSIIKKYILTTPKTFLIGIGAGNAEYSQVSILTSVFYHKYYSINYNMFTYSFIFIEMGILGLIVYWFQFFWYLCVFIYYYFNSNNKYDSFILLSIVLSCYCIIAVIYDIGFRSEITYFTFMFLSLPFLLQLHDKEIGYNEK